MPEADFFLTERDEYALVERMLADSAELVPDLLYPAPQATAIESAEPRRPPKLPHLWPPQIPPP